MGQMFDPAAPGLLSRSNFKPTTIVRHGSFTYVACAVLMMLAQVYAFAQPKEHFQAGLKGGVNFSRLSGADALPGFKRKLGYSLGAFVSYKLPKNLKAQMEFIWSLQGDDSEDKGRYDISYLNVPVMLKWGLSGFYLEAGPQLGFLTINSSTSVPDDLRFDDFESLDLSMSAGLGFELFQVWGVGMRYSHSLINVVEGMDLRNSVIYLGVSYRIL